jgi:hypothetical protein
MILEAKIVNKLKPKIRESKSGSHNLYLLKSQVFKYICIYTHTHI